MSFHDDQRGQVIIVAGVTIAIAIIAFATIYFSAGMAGQRTIGEEKEEIGFVFNDVRDTYGRILREVSTNGEKNPFNGTNGDLLSIYETQLGHLENQRGYFIVFTHAPEDYDNATIPTANVSIRLSDANTVYVDAVSYNLRTGEVL
jgi:hypothetical protein